MNRDLEAQLCEMGDAYRVVVDRLKAGREAERKVEAREARKPSGGWLIAASLALIVALGSICLWQASRPACPVRPQPRSAPHEFSMSVEEMIATQNADGGWKSDFLTRQNAAALKLCDSREARIAYKKAMRNLRVRGLL